MAFIHICVSADSLVHQSSISRAYGEGVMLPFVRRLLDLQQHTTRSIEVSILLSCPLLIASGQLIAVNLRGVRVVGELPQDVDLFLSCDSSLVEAAFVQGIPSALVQEGHAFADTGDGLKVAFDADGVICDRSSEERYRTLKMASTATIPQYYWDEWNERYQTIGAGPMARFAQKLSLLRDELHQAYGSPCPHLQVILCTARNHRALSRMINSTDALGIFFDRVLALGHDRKADYLEVPKVHLFMDDIQSHLDYARLKVPCAKVPELLFSDRQGKLP